MAKRRSKATDQYTHPSAKRANLPTEQTGKTMSDTDRRPVMHQPETREVDDEPILAWNRRPAEGGHAAHPLYVREKVHPAAFVKLLQGGGEQPSLFADFNGLPSPDAAYEWYQHAANWSNRLIHGESTRVMASLLARESMAGKVQMIYFDPPYGMGYKSASPPRPSTTGPSPTRLTAPARRPNSPATTPPIRPRAAGATTRHEASCTSVSPRCRPACSPTTWIPTRSCWWTGPARSGPWSVSPRR